MMLKLTWLQKLMGYDRRHVRERLASQLVAYYWDGSNPIAHRIRNINMSGAYLVTDQRWYPGTIVRITLQRSGHKDVDERDAIAVQAQVVRADTDGVGLRFILPETTGSTKTWRSGTDCVDRKTLRAFLQSIRNADDEGQSLVEFALCLPILLLIITGICTFGIAFNNFITLTNSVSSGARLLAIYRGQTTDPCNTASSAVLAGSPYLNPTNLSFTVVLNGTTYTGTSCSSSSTTTGAAGNLLQGTAATLTVTYPCNLKVYGMSLAPNCTLRAQSTEYVQ
jgi:Flp pilus assembly protein TadG